MFIGLEPASGLNYDRKYMATCLINIRITSRHRFEAVQDQVGIRDSSLKGLDTAVAVYDAATMLMPFNSALVTALGSTLRIRFEQLNTIEDRIRWCSR